MFPDRLGKGAFYFLAFMWFFKFAIVGIIYLLGQYLLREYNALIFIVSVLHYVPRKGYACLRSITCMDSKDNKQLLVFLTNLCPTIAVMTLQRMDSCSWSGRTKSNKNLKMLRSQPQNKYYINSNPVLYDYALNKLQ